MNQIIKFVLQEENSNKYIIQISIEFCMMNILVIFFNKKQQSRIKIIQINHCYIDVEM